MTKVVVLSVDLIDRSKLSAAFPDAVLVRSVSALVDAAADADLALVDLGRADAAELEPIATMTRVVGFGSHVHEAVLDAARAVGIEALPRSVFFRRLGDGTL